MSDFQTVRGFEDVWRPPVRPRRRTPLAIIESGGASGGEEGRARLTRIVSRAPEVMVKITGRTRDPGHLRSHLDYISRNGDLELEDRDGALMIGRGAVRELADDWSATALADSHRRANTPFSHSVMLSMPAGTDPAAIRDAARAFAKEVFADRFDYAFALHTDVEHPHVHLEVRSLGDHGERLNPKKADLDHWRQIFAQALRDRGVEAAVRTEYRRLSCGYLAGQDSRSRSPASGSAGRRSRSIRPAAGGSVRPAGSIDG